MKTSHAKLIGAAVIMLLCAASAFGHPLVSNEALAGCGALLMVGDIAPVHHNVLELFKNVPWKMGVDPQAGIHIMKSALFNSDGSPKPIPSEKLQAMGFMKAFTQPGTATSGLAQYDLEQGARLLYTITTLFRNMIPRLTGGTGIQSNWRAVTAVNPTRINIGLSEGHRGAFMSQTVVDRTASFRTSGMDDYVTLQAYLASVTFQDLYALAATTLLQGTMEQEEYLDIGGNGSLSLGTTGTPTGTKHTTGGYLSDGTTNSIICVALTYLGMTNSTAPTVANDGSLSGGAIALPYTRTNADGSTDYIAGFSAIQSAASGAIVLDGSGSLQSITASVTAKNGAIGYAWFFGLTAGSEKLVAITGYPTVTIKNTNPTGQAATAVPTSAVPADPSINPLNYDGLLTQILTPGSGAYVKDLGGAAFTTAGSGTGQCAEINTAIASFFSNYRLIPTDIYMSATDQQALGSIVLTGNTNLAPFFMGGSSEGGLQASTTLKRYINPIGFGNPYLDVHAHPFLPAGTIMFYSRTNPYPISNVPQLVRSLCRRDYWQVDWPETTLNRTMGVYFDKVLQMYFPPAFGAITGIKN